MAKHGLTDSQRFWQKVAIRGPDDCWLWRAAKGKDGTGRFTISHGNDQRFWRAHRFAYFDKVADAPQGAMVIHTCGVDLCCNPRHLKHGDAKTRMAEVRKRGNLAAGSRSGVTREAYARRGEELPTGERAAAAKLTDAQAAEIRASNEPLAVLVLRYGVSTTAIKRVRRHETYVPHKQTV